MEKNRDTFRDDLLNLLRESRYISVIFVCDMMITGVLSPNSARVYHLILPEFEYVRCCIVSDLDRVETSIEEISEVPVSRSDCNRFSQSQFLLHCTVPCPCSVQRVARELTCCSVVSKDAESW